MPYRPSKKDARTRAVTKESNTRPIRRSQTRTLSSRPRADSPAKSPFAAISSISRKAPAAALPQPKSEYPMRINKYLAHKGYATRKASDELVEKRRVFINNKRAVLGDKVSEGDVVEVRLDKKDAQQKLVYFAYNKPRSVITHSPQGDESEIRDMVPELTEQYGVFPVGRLDKDSHGLIILTNDGRIVDRLLSPTRDHEKEYIVQTKHKLRSNFKERMESGVQIEDGMTKPTKVTIRGEQKFTVTLTEGKKHQIRRMVVALFNEVSDLERTRVLNIELGKLGTGKYRPIEGEELATFLKALGL